jgi:hypothetical protein
MSRLARAVIFVFSIMNAAGAFATNTYYISYSLGSDQNTPAQAKSKSTPWKDLPGCYGATGNAASYNPQPGDSFILYGGDTWPNSALGCNWTGSGLSSTPTSSCLGNGNSCTSSGYIYVGVDQTWYTGSAWSRPILNAGGSVVNPPSNGVANAVFRLAANYVIVDNLECTGLYWSGSPAYGSGVCFPLWAGSPGDGTHDIFEHNYVHGWSHGTAGSGTQDNPCAFLGDSGIPNNNVNSYLYQNVVDGSDTAKDSCSAIFAGPPFIVQNFVQYVSSMAVINGTILVDGNTFQNGVSSFSGGHENCIEINASYNVTVSNNVCAHLASGMLGFWSAPYPGYTSTFFNNVMYDTDVNNIFDIAPPVYTGGNCTQNGNSVYCTTGGTTNAYNNTIECGQNSNPNAVCAAGIFSGTTAVNLENNHWITNATSPNGGMWSTNGPTPTVTTNVLQTLSAANGQGYNESETYPFSPTAGNDATVGAGTNLTLLLGLSFPAILTDTSVGVGYNSTTHVVSYPNRAPNSRPSVGAWDAGAYEFNASGDPPSPPTGLTAIVN